MKFFIFVLLIPAIAGGVTSNTELGWINEAGEFTVSWFNLTIVIISNTIFHSLDS